MNKLTKLGLMLSIIASANSSANASYNNQDKIENQVNFILDQNPAIDRQIDVEIKRSQIRLEGKVANYKLKEKVESKFKGVKGVNSIDNVIKVTFNDKDHIDEIDRLPKYTEKSDKELARLLEHRFFYSRQLDSDNIKLSVHHGEVTLNGMVEDTKAKERALEITRNSGANKIVDRLKIHTI